MSAVNFSEEQIDIYKSKGGNFVVKAAPGSGKTTVLAKRTALLISEGVEPKQILVLMFGSDAVKHFVNRLRFFLSELGMSNSEDKLPKVLTFHAIALRTLNFLAKRGLIPPFKLEANDFRYNEALRASVKSTVEPSDFKKIQNKNVKVTEEFKTFVEYTKSWMISPQEAMDMMYRNADDRRRLGFFVEAYDNFENVRIRTGQKYFSDLVRDLIIEAENNPEIKAIISNKKDYFISDEFQDTNHAQFRLIKMLIGDKAEMMVCGDIDQAIFNFAGADPKIMLSEFKESFKSVDELPLSSTYRFGENLASLSNNLIKHNQERFELEAVSSSNETTRCFISMAPDYSRDICDIVSDKINKGVNPNNIAVITRVHSDAMPVELRLRKKGIPCTNLTGINFVNSYEFQMIKALLTICMGKDLELSPNDRSSLYAAIANYPRKGISADAVRNAVSKTSYANGDVKFFLNQIRSGIPRWMMKKMYVIEEAIIEVRAAYNQNKSMKAIDVIKDYARKTSAESDIKSSAITSQDAFEAQNRFEHVLNFISDLGSVSDCLEELSSINSSNENTIDSVVIASAHKAKGMEWDYVYIPNVVDGAWPYKKIDPDPCIETERRLFYVAMTRAKKELYIHTDISSELVSCIRNGGVLEKEQKFMSTMHSRTTKNNSGDFVLETKFKVIDNNISSSKLPTHIEVRG